VESGSLAEHHRRLAENAASIREQWIETNRHEKELAVLNGDRKERKDDIEEIKARVSTLTRVALTLACTFLTATIAMAALLVQIITSGH
jgi:hypothetical protein